MVPFILSAFCLPSWFANCTVTLVVPISQDCTSPKLSSIVRIWDACIPTGRLLKTTLDVMMWVVVCTSLVHVWIHPSPLAKLSSTFCSNCMLNSSALMRAIALAICFASSESRRSSSASSEAGHWRMHLHLSLRSFNFLRGGSSGLCCPFSR